MRPYALNIKGRLISFSSPSVMGIINATPDSFFPDSRTNGADDVKERVRKMVDAGAAFIDVGAFSTRPGYKDVSVDEELKRLDAAMSALRSVAPDVIVSVDTFRAEVARRAIRDMGADIINDVGCGILDPEMFETVADLKCPYVLMHMRGNLANIHESTTYDNILVDVVRELAEKYVQLCQLGVCDVIIDPGFGFNKDLEQNYMLLKNLHIFDIFKSPIIVGLSRKSMLTQLLKIDAANALQATTALNMFALQHGASILRVHDVLPAVHAIKIYQQLS